MSPNQGRPATGHPGSEAFDLTCLESDEEIRQALQARRSRLATKPRPTPPGTPAQLPVAIPVEVEPQAERPAERPPLAMLCVLDDGAQDGEWVRLRADRTVIGRNEGDVRILHDRRMSGQHAELVRQLGPKGYRWLLADLQSRNGTFVRFGSTLLRHENEVLIGAGRYRFEGSAGEVPPLAIPTTPPGAQPWWAEGRAQVPSLVELAHTGPVNRYPLTLPEYWIGRDAQVCAIARPDDVLVNARHARLFRDARGWHLENNKSLNGVWLRLTEPMPLSKACQFRLGEQRFLFRVT